MRQAPPTTYFDSPVHRDTPLPGNRDLVSHGHRVEGVAPKVTHVAVFDYADGSQREFNGAWTLTRPSNLAT
mgnify:CR=1 FL=1|tara:strand:- start:990 stop:1202 length:213 start_codon:yes stop_codon:yes gene_type:complete